MVPIDIPPELLTKTLPELLNLLAAGKISKDLYDAVTSRVKELRDKKEYGFTPDPQTAVELKNITQSDAYKRMHWIA